MKKLIIYIIITIIASSSLLLNILNFKPAPPKTEDQPSPETETPSPNNKPKSITEILNNMTLDEKIGQLFIIAYREPEMNSELNNLLTKVQPGGFIFFKENFKTTSSSKELINSIKKTAKIPLFLSIDEEGGRISRLNVLKDIKLNTIPSMAEIGTTNSTEAAYNTGTLIANNLKKFDLNMDFAPVLDIYSNPDNKVIGDRSFGSNPYLVTKMGLALGKSLQKNNIIPVYKHFPGHGDTSTDSHISLPIITKTKEELLANELIPFKEAIKNNAEVIMIGHLAVPSITGDNTPASLSKKLITNYLKNELNYQNIVITDALNMKAITNNYSDKKIYELALTAGVDILLMPNNPLKGITYIKELIKEKKIDEKQINNSVTKILELKRKYNII